MQDEDAKIVLRDNRQKTFQVNKSLQHNVAWPNNNCLAMKILQITISIKLINQTLFRSNLFRLNKIEKY